MFRLCFVTTFLEYISVLWAIHAVDVRIGVKFIFCKNRRHLLTLGIVMYVLFWILNVYSFSEQLDLIVLFIVYFNFVLWICP